MVSSKDDRHGFGTGAGFPFFAELERQLVMRALHCEGKLNLVFVKNVTTRISLKVQVNSQDLYSWIAKEDPFIPLTCQQLLLT